MPLYGAVGYDPIYIISQIVLLQALQYLAFGIVIAASHILLGTPVSLDTIFSIESNMFGMEAFVVALFFIPVTGALFLTCVVERAKKCADFTVTYYLFHVALCCVYSNEIPTGYGFWLTNVVSACCMAVLGERLCMRLEIQDVSVSDILSGLQIV